MPINDVIRKKLSNLPHKPGVYLMKDRFGRVIYVGKARSLRKRVSQYFHPSRRHGWDLKLAALIEAIQSFDVHIVSSESEALLLEGKLIKDYKPRYNVSFRDDKRFLLLKVNMEDEIPRFTFTRFRNDDQSLYFGPFAHSGAARRTLEALRQRFRLRGCRAHRPGPADHKHCLYAQLDTCDAPCVGNVSLEDYKSTVQRACDFLAGSSKEIIDDLESEMVKAAEALEFERAAALRDAVRDMRETTEKHARFRKLPHMFPSSIQPQNDLEGLKAHLKLSKIPETIEGFDISNISGTLAVASMVAFRNGRPNRAQYRRFRIRDVEGQDDFACMAEAVRRRYTRVLRESPQTFPDLIVIDGGKGQLNAAVKELKNLGIDAPSIIGLAKEFEEIYQPGVSEPLRLNHDDGALKALQRVRDESHRFANGYNAALRAKKHSESILDECPGLGPRRKQLLLQEFGSVQRLKSASVEQLTSIPGIGRKFAEEALDFLHSRLG